MSRPPLHHILRIRSSDDLTFVRDGIMDEILINANQLENSLQSTAACLRQTALPFAVDPVLWRFQIPQWWRNEKGDVKKNYARLGATYVEGTNIDIGAGPLLETVPSDADWRALGTNAINYQRSRLVPQHTQLDLLGEEPRELRPVRLIAPALVANSAVEDRINRLLVEASRSTAEAHVAVQVIVPPDRLIDPSEVARLLATIPSDDISSYFIWTPTMTEQRLLADEQVFTAVLRLIATLADRGIPVGHQYGNYTIAALHDLGVAALVHHLGWVDKGEPAEEQGFMLRSCQSYVPAVRHCLRFKAAAEFGRQLDPAEYARRYCECSFCSGAFEAGQHPLDLLLEDRVVPFRNGTQRRTPTGRAVAVNTWHYLLSRRLEIESFTNHPAIEVIERDIERAAELAGREDTERLQRLAKQLHSAA
jgi:hypothetical protein